MVLGKLATQFGSTLHAAMPAIGSQISHSACNLSRYCRILVSGGARVVQIVGVQVATYGHTGHGGFLP
jgi:uncharacterized Zn-binding protein involved in type VI secretion